VFQLQDKQPISGLPVHVEIRGTKDSQWREILQSTTGPDGAVSTPLILGNSSVVRLRSDSSWERLSSQSSEMQVNIAGKLSLNAPTSSPIGVPMFIKGSIQPKRSGVEISIEKFTLGAWKPVTGKTQTDGSGNFSLSVTETTRSLARYRVIMGNDDKANGIMSSIFTVVMY
jgi:hypothetical protein